MIKEGMLVRCPIDDENIKFPRAFGIGRIKSINQISEKATIEFMDVNGISIYHQMPNNCEIEITKLVRCKIRKFAVVVSNRQKMQVCASEINKNDEFRYYYLKDTLGHIIYICETEIKVSYNDFEISPLLQLKTYEFQNPIWFFGRSIVSKTMNYIDNSLYGFKDLAGCKIFLKPYQLKTVMRCLQTPPCRYMLADEVGLGKTVEALSILKIFINDNKNKDILIVVPDALVEQWRNELAFKFKLFEGININGNLIILISYLQIDNYASKKFDFVIFDEVHRCLKIKETYNKVLGISKNTDNILMLSATPLQKRDEEFLKLLCLIQPKKYENINKDKFNELLEQQNKIVRKIFNALDELGALNDALIDSDNEKNEETEEIYDAVKEELISVSGLIEDKRFNDLLLSVKYDSDDCGISGFQNVIAYVCENFQLEKSIIRNRRKKVNVIDDTNSAQRKLVDISYEVDNEYNIDEWNVYTSFSDWIENEYRGELDYNNDLIPVIHALFSSAQAFKAKLNLLSKKVKIPKELINFADIYAKSELKNIKNVESLSFNCKIHNIVEYLLNSLSIKKVILFTDYKETFDIYKEILIKIFGEIKCCFFSKDMDPDELELSAYRFQTDGDCQILLSDPTGGEGRNFQHADLIIHIDIPWNANDIEQRIGRLDRIGRNPNNDIVSVVVYGKDTVEESLFKLWNDGLNLFTQAQSGLEIIMGDIEEAMVSCLKSSFKYGLNQANLELNELIRQQLDSLKKEQVYDIAAYQYKNINRMLDETVEKYTKNETNLFGEAMMSWASLSGFNGREDGDNIVSFSQNSISFKSLSKTLFMPPNMKAIIDNKLNQMRNKVRVLNNERIKYNDTSYIRGTFNRNKALQNDYLNFFAPGDDIFDAITNNAISSYKGTCSCFACKSEINWRGFVFAWKIVIDDSIIYKNNISEHLINQYKGYLPSEQIITVYDDSDSGLDDNIVITEFNSILHNYNSSKVKHLGKRDGLNSAIMNFIKAFPLRTKWAPLVSLAYDNALEKAKVKSEQKRKILLNALYNELLSTLSAQKAAALYFNQVEDIDKAKKDKEIIYSMIKNAGIKLDSVCYVVMQND